MDRRFDEIARRKQILVERCERNRNELAACFRQIRLPLNLGMLLTPIGKVLRAYPMAAAGLSSLLATGYAVKLTRVAGKAIGMIRVARPLWSWWSKRRRRK
jgi:hypothetical protein